MNLETKDILISMKDDIKEIKEAILSLPKWISLTDVSHDKELTPQAVRKKLGLKTGWDYTKAAHF